MSAKQSVLSEAQIAEFTLIARSAGLRGAFDKLAADIVKLQTTTEDCQKEGLRRSQMDYLDNVFKGNGDIAVALTFAVALCSPLITGNRVNLEQRDLIAARRAAQQALIEIERARKVLETLRGDIVS